jgi:predicted ATPase
MNFELKLDRVNLLLGENGTGKTTVFDVLHRLQEFLAGNAKVLAVFPSADLTRWQSNAVQRFELELSLDGSIYSYALVIEHDEDRRRTKIKSEMQKLMVVGPQPMLMTAESREEAATLSRFMENFVSWYRYLSQEHQGALLTIFPELKRVMPGFNACNLKEAGEAPIMKVLFDRSDGSGRPIVYDFKELSDGQRTLIALYSLLFGLKDEGLAFS